MFYLQISENETQIKETRMYMYLLFQLNPNSLLNMLFIENMYEITNSIIFETNY